MVNYAMRAKILLLFLLVVLFGGGCALLDPPGPPVIPTPPPAPVAAIDFESLELVTNPSTDIAPAIDPDIATLVNNVSTQQLLGYVQTLEGFGTRHPLSETGRPDYGVGAARNWIFDEFERVGGGRLQVRMQDFEMNYNGLVSPQQNIVATLPGIGTHPGVIVFTAHYDSRSIDPDDPFSRAPGANDNASGVAMLLEAARLLSSRNWNQTIIFVAFAAEELGSYGSFNYVQTSMLDGMQFDAVINSDIIGGRPGIPRSIRVFAPGPDNSPSLEVARYMAYVSQLYTPTFVVDIQNALDREGRWSDHREFINAGVGAVRLTESVEDPDVQHNSQDTAEKLDYDYLARVTALNVATAASYAGAPGRPIAPTVTPMADPGAFILTWPTDPVAAGYALSFREVGSFDYPSFQFVSAEEAGNIAVTGLDTSKRYYLSIAAIDVNGRLGFFSPEVLVEPAAP